MPLIFPPLPDERKATVPTATKKKAPAKKSSNSQPTAASLKAADKRKAHEKPDEFVGDFRERIADAINKLVEAGEPEFADLYRQLRKVIDVNLPNAVGQRDKRYQEKALDEARREQLRQAA